MKLTKKQLQEIIREELSNINEDAVSNAKKFDKAFKDLVDDVKNRKGVDSRAYDKYSDGEILGTIIKGILQSGVMKLQNPKEFWVYLKK